MEEKAMIHEIMVQIDANTTVPALKGRDVSDNAFEAVLAPQETDFYGISKVIVYKDAKNWWRLK